MPETVRLQRSHTEMTEVLLPNDTNSFGRALGGAVLHWMDICGAIASMRFAGRLCVTAAMDHVDFISPIEEGEIAVIEAYVFETGTTSLEVIVDVHAEAPWSDGTPRETTTSFFTFVALDDSGAPTPVPEVSCPTEAEVALRDEAIERRRRQRAAFVEAHTD
ncbi:MAG: acyl-CoA thioesterase [Halobacteriales archaeon]